MPTPPKLIVSLKFVDRDADGSDTTIMDLEEKDPLQIIEPDTTEGNPWDQAHQLVDTSLAYSFAEPELDSSEIFYRDILDTEERGDMAESGYFEYIDYWPHPDFPMIWHLEHEYSQIREARDEVAALSLPANRVVRVAHLDTGYSKNHDSFPAAIIRNDLQRSFVEGEEDHNHSAEDRFDDGKLKMPGHGTGTLSILAGARQSIPQYNFDDYFGLSANIEIVPIRIAKSVVLFKSGALVRALNYIINELNQKEDTRIHVITMSMGGLASKAWAEFVNLAYDRGIFIVTAAGNNFKKLPTRTMVYPARFNRVVAACGVTYDYSPYSKPHGSASFQIMEGNYGPSSLMKSAVAAFTPNVPWATYRFDHVTGIRGDGTSSATPQVAIAAALYYLKHYEALEALPKPWMRVEAIRKALFDSARKEINTAGGQFDNDMEKYFGNGILQAAAMLACEVPAPDALKKQDTDKVIFPFFKLIFGLRALEEPEQREEEMLETELMQLVLSDERLQELLADEEKELEQLSKDEKKTLAELVISNPAASEKLKNSMQLILNQLSL